MSISTIPLASPLSAKLIDGVNELIALHRAAIDLCDDAAARIDDLRVRVRLHELVTLHFSEVDALSRWVTHLGAKPSRRSSPGREPSGTLRSDDDLVRCVVEAEQELSQAFRQLADALGGDQGVAEELRSVATGPRRQREALLRGLEARLAA